MVVKEHDGVYEASTRLLSPSRTLWSIVRAMPFVGKHHGTSGPVRTGFNDNSMPIEADVIMAADEATGLSKKPVDPWSGDHIGFYNTLGSVVRTGPNRGKA